MRRTSLAKLGIPALAGALVAGCQLFFDIQENVAGPGGSGTTSSNSSSGTSTSSSSSGTGGADSGSGGTGGSGGMIDPRGLGVWAVSLGAAKSAKIAGMATDTSGNVYLTGSFKDTMTLGGASSTNPDCHELSSMDKNAEHGFLIKLDGNGTCVWATSFGGAGGIATGTAVAVTTDGDVVFAGTWNKPSTGPGTATLPMPEGVDTFVARYNHDKIPPQDIPNWISRLGGMGDQQISSLALNDTGVAYAAGSYTEKLQSKPTTSIDKMGSANKTGFAVMLDAQGVFSTSIIPLFSTPAVDVDITSVAFSNGRVALTGYANGAVNYGNGPPTAKGGLDGFFVVYDAALAYQNGGWLADTNDQVAQQALFGAESSLYITGSFTGTLDFGNGKTITSASPSMFATSINASGQAQKAIHFGATAKVDPLSSVHFASDENGNIVFAGALTGPVSVEGKNPPESEKQGDNVVVGKIDGALAMTQWIHSFGTEGVEGADAVGVVSDGIIIAGRFQKSLDFGNGKSVSANADDIFVAKLVP